MATSFFCPSCRRDRPIQGRVIVRRKDGNFVRYKCAVCVAKTSFKAKAA